MSSLKRKWFGFRKPNDGSPLTFAKLDGEASILIQCRYLANGAPEVVVKKTDHDTAKLVFECGSMVDIDCTLLGPILDAYAEGP